MTRILVDQDWVMWLKGESVLHDSNASQTSLLQCVGHVTSHSSLPYELCVKVVFNLLSYVLVHVVFDSFIKLFLIADESRTVRSLLDGDLQCLLLHRELVRIYLALVLLLQ